MDLLTHALHQAGFHALQVRDSATVAYWVPRDGRDYHIVEALAQAALLADHISLLRAQRPDLAFKADAAVVKWRAVEAKQREEGARAHG